MLLRRVVGCSMEPTLRAGRLIIAVKPRKKVCVGDIVVISLLSREIIKRVALCDDGFVYVLGDNTELSTDSRVLGWLADSSICGRVIWPRKKNLRRVYQG